MPAAVHLITGPARSGKTAQLIERCRAAAGTRGDGILWLCPDRRRLDQLRGRLAGIANLHLTTFADLADELLAATLDVGVPGRGQGRVLLDEIIAELHDRKKLKHFVRVAETLGFLDGAAALVAELHQHSITADDLLALPSEAADRLHECALMLGTYQQRLRTLHFVDVDARVARAVGLLRADQHWRLVVLDDFTTFTTPQLSFLGELAAQSEELWLSLPDEEGDDRGELFAPARQTEERLCLVSENVSRTILRTQKPAPPGLTHLESHLFRPLRQTPVGDDATGIYLIEAPGQVGEARLVARRIKTLLLDGVAAESFVVALRDLDPHADLLREVFEEYGLPLDIEGTEPLLRHRLIALLLRALRLPEDDWPFAEVTALLRSSFVKPDWPEARFDEDVPLRAEALLRLLGEPRGRNAYLEAAKRWAKEKPRGLEDEQAQESRRQRTHELAQQCAPFLERFFACWDAMPTSAPLADHVAWLRGLVADLGLTDDHPAWKRFWDEVQLWLDRDQRHGGRKRLDRRTFHRRLHALAEGAGLPRSPRGAGRVRVLTAETAASLDIHHLFVLGLGERGFPRLAVPSSMLDETERQALREQGSDIACLAEALSREMLLFYRLVTRAKESLTLSYAAVDEKGQTLLPSSFLSAVLDLFEAVPGERRTMLSEGQSRDEPLSPAEQRVRLALSLANGGSLARGTPMHDNLCDALDMGRQRLRSRACGSFEGMLSDPTIVAQLRANFGPERVFSPTALEDYVACPFRFFLQHVLRLDPLENPREEIEVTRRGQAFHRALSRLHLQLRAAGIHRPTDGLEHEVRVRLSEVIAEDVSRAAGLASKKLWELEGERMLKLAHRYPKQWKMLIEPWEEVRVQPEPYFFEIDFGLPVEEGQIPHPPLILHGEGIEVRISGRIDRVDVAELEDGGRGFWIIDYKTGRSEHYTGTALAEFQRLQLTLYALAVEEVLLNDRQSRPLGLAYWLLTDIGPKIVLPARSKVLWLKEGERWLAVRRTLANWVTTLVSHIREGKYPLRPRSEQCTLTCNYSEICRIGQSRSVEKDWVLPLPLVTQG